MRQNKSWPTVFCDNTISNNNSNGLELGIYSHNELSIVLVKILVSFIKRENQCLQRI